MKIDRPSQPDSAAPHGIGKAGSPVGLRGDSARKVALPKDQVAISRSAQQVSKAYTQLRSVPEVRMGLVQRLQTEIAAGTYKVPTLLLAERLLQSGVLDE